MDGSRYNHPAAIGLDTPPASSAMATYEDLAPFSPFGSDLATTLRTVGWLGNGAAFTTGTIESECFEKLKSLLIDPWQPFVSMGVHQCELCQFDAPSGSRNLFVPNRSDIYVCPELITHYIAAHHYRPPVQFLEAVLDCPDTRSMAYKKLLLASGGGKLFSRER